MAKIQHQILRAYLNKSVRRLSFDDIQAARHRFDAMSTVFSGPHLSRVKDLVITDDNIRVRLYSADGKNLKYLPVIVFFHGGGFVLGSIESHDAVARNLCKYTGCLVVSVDYGLAPQYQYPSQNQQGLRVVEWLINNHESINIDPKNIFLAGDSAGGAIAVEMALAARKGLFSGVIIAYPALNPRLNTASMQQYAKNYFLTKDMLANFWHLYGVDVDHYWSPSDGNLAKLPPTLIIAAEKDVLRDEGRDFADMLQDVEYHCYSDMLHGFLQFPNIVSKKAQAFAQIGVFVSKNLR